MTETEIQQQIMENVSNGFYHSRKLPSNIDRTDKGNYEYYIAKLAYDNNKISDEQFLVERTKYFHYVKLK